MSTVVVACGALALHLRKIADRRGWDLEIRPVPPELHNRPERIVPALREQIKAHYNFFSPLHRELTLKPMTDFTWLTPAPR